MLGKHVHFADEDSPIPESPPPKYADYVHPHPNLQPSSVNWDLVDHPTTLAWKNHSISSQTLDEPATSPPLSYMTINAPLLPWTIKVHAINGSYITLGEVFDSIYKSLRRNISQSEYNSLLPNMVKRRAVRAYEKRCRRQPDIRTAEEERRNGMKRIDFLMENTGFLGISNTGRRPDEWQLLITLGGPPPSDNRDEQLRTASSESPAHNFAQAHPPPPSSNGIEDAHEQHRATSSESLAPTFGQTNPSPASIDDTHEQPKATSTESARMFEHAHDLIVSGGEFYAAGSMNIDASHNKDASTHSTNVAHLWQLHHVYNQIKFPGNPGGQVDCQKEGSKGDGDPSLGSINRRGEDRAANEGEETKSQANNERPRSDLDHPSGLAESELENHDEQAMQDVIITSATSSADQTLTDDIIFDILSNYPQAPTGNHRMFERIFGALMVSFSPLSSMMIAALFNLDNAQQVEQILLPAYPLIFVPQSGSNMGENDDQTPVRFIDPSMVGFFLDRTRGGRYFVDAPLAHRVLLDGCTSVMETVYQGGQGFDKMGSGWRDAYEYACQNWEGHRRAGTRSKL